MINSYFILVDGQQTGPFTHDELMDNNLQPDAFVLSPLATEWQQAIDLPEFNEYFVSQGIYQPAKGNYANFGWRLLAYLIDQFIYYGFFAIIGGLIGAIMSLTGGEFGSIFINIEDVLQVVITFSGFFINAFLETTTLQGSLGKLICKLAVVNIHGGRETFLQALGRNFGKILSSLICGLGFLNVAWDSKRQGWHDQLAKTYVIKKRG
ncbi:hypothetical protein GCM10023149_32820 [Mucilaginibacter gynuensis]|uniref:RDD family protein n=1 Tax=Mucilaginibacter gynuensis TaxID=1302236 RepID=A0ABP8GQT7_9SPHI